MSYAAHFAQNVPVAPRFATTETLRRRARVQTSAELSATLREIKDTKGYEGNSDLRRIFKVVTEELWRRTMADGQYL
jgi:hypothetical protein